jgi:asparagine synthase (glutamine-hydrolysing)
MCGIAGIFAYSDAAPPVDREELLKIREVMINRGPDGAGVWISSDRRIGLAHRRLAIIDLTAAAAQPMTDFTGRYSIVFNGEIYNFRALKTSLEIQGYCFKSNSDTEVLLNLYAANGPEMVKDLRGMYAFAIWDNKKQSLFLTRDPFGIKPLYYADDGKTLRIASQVKALLKGGKVNTDAEPAGQVGFYIWGSVPEPFTLFKSIKALPAGSTLLIDTTGKKETGIFFHIAKEVMLQPDNDAGNKNDRRAELRGALLDSIRCHLVADVPVGIFLSSGKDSTTITALTSEIKPENLRTVTLGFEEYRGTRDDETPLAEVVARRYGTDHQTIWVSKDEFHADLEHIFSVMDQPTIDGINTYFVSKAASKAGLKVALSGLGADELFGGYPSFKEIPRMVGLFGMFRNLPWFGKLFRKYSTRFVNKLTSPKYAGIFEYATNYGSAYLLRRSLFMPWELSGFLEPEIIAKGWENLQTIFYLEDTVKNIPHANAKITALESCFYMRNQLLRDSDWAGMAHSIEIRVPFVDITLLRKIKHIAGSDFVTKSELASTPVRLLPHQVLARKKTGFNIPTKLWITGGSERGLRGWSHEVYKNCFK